MGPRLFRVGQVPYQPGVAPVLRVKGVAPAQPVPGLHPRLQPRVYRRRGFGDYPPPLINPDGSPGNPLYPYDENGLWGDGSTGGAVPATVSTPPAVGTPLPTLDQVQQQSVSVPFGESARDWVNPMTYATVPLLGNLTVTTGQTQNLPLLSLNLKRNSLIIQNQSSATAAGDVAPTLYIGFNVQAVVGQSLALPPGLGFFWGASDCPPRDSIFVALGPFSNGGGTVTIAGCVIQGTYVPNGTPYRPSYGVVSQPGGGSVEG